MEGFELFTRYKTPSAKEMQVTIQRAGISITLNRAAFEAIGNPTGVQLYYGKRSNQIGIKPIDIATEPGTRINRQGNSESFYIAGKAFTNYHDIDTSIARRYKAKLVNGMLIVDLNGPSADVTGPRMNQSTKKTLLDNTHQPQLEHLHTKEVPKQPNPAESDSTKETMDEIKVRVTKLLSQGIPLDEILLKIGGEHDKFF